MSLLAIEKFGGVMPKIIDPRELPEGKGQVATNCRFDRGGVYPIYTDLFVQTPTRPGIKLSLFLYVNYFFHWITDVNAVNSPTPADAFNRVYFTEGGELKVTDSTIALTGGTNYPNASYLPSPPAPGSVLSATVTGSISDRDPTKKETRNYVFTFVNGYGDEGPPSLASNKAVWAPGQSVLLSTPQTVPEGAYNIVAVNVYRLNEDASGDKNYQFVYQTSIANLGNMPTDTVADDALGELLQTTEWDGAPSGVKGLISLPNSGLACYLDKTVCLSVPGFPHAWPVKYQKYTDWVIMGLGAWGTTLLVLTQGIPYLITFTDPSNPVMDKMNQGLGCMVKTSVVDMGGFIMYASTDGLTAIGPNVNDTLTKNLFTPENWRATFNPSTIKGYLWSGKYVGFYTDSNYSQAGFIFDPVTGDFVFLDFYATAGYRDPKSGTLYLQIGNDIVAFDSGADSRTMYAKSKRYIQKPTRFNLIKVVAPAYPVTVNIIYPVLNQTDTVTVTSNSPQRISPTPVLIDTVEVMVYGQKGVTAVFLATVMDELPL